MVFFLTGAIWSLAQNPARIYRRVSGAVVKLIVVKNNVPLPGNGSGVIVKSRGWIITNFHVIDRKGDLLVAMHEADNIIADSIVAYDKAKDILILALSKDNDPAVMKSVPDIKIRGRKKLKVGERIYAIGSPFGLENTITEGLISGLRASGDSMQSLIQISAPISPGSSGGAVVDSRGRLVGISTMYLKGRGAQNLNFAILAEDVVALSEGERLPLGKSRETTSGYFMDQGSADYGQGKYRLAMINYHKARSLSTGPVQKAKILHNLGLCWERLERKDSAIHYYRSALLSHSTLQTYRALAVCLNNMGDYAGAIRNFKEVLRLSPRDYDANFMLAGSYTFSGDPESAKPYLQKALRMKPGYAPAHHLAGRVYAAAKEYDTAIGHFLRAIELQPGYLEAYQELIEAFAAKGDFVNAEAWTEKMRKAAK